MINTKVTLKIIYNIAVGTVRCVNSGHTSNFEP